MAFMESTVSSNVLAEDDLHRYHRWRGAICTTSLTALSWDPPSPRVRELIRQGAEIALNPRPEWLAEIDAATLGAAAVGRESPATRCSPRRCAGATRANLLFWAAANVSEPGAPVAANDGAEPLAIARDLVRRGLNESALEAYRVGEAVAGRRSMAIACALTSDPEEVREVLDVSVRSIVAFVDATVAGIAERMQVERDELTRGAPQSGAKPWA